MRKTTRWVTAAAALLAGILANSLPASADVPIEASGYVDLGIGQQRASWLMLIEPGLSLRSQVFDLDLVAPLQFNLSDSFKLWEKDWDDLSDAGRVLRNASLVMNDGAFRMKLGVLNHTTFGHGTMVQGFISSLNPDMMPLGASLYVQTGAITIEAMASDVFGPEVFGGSVSIEPVSLSGTQYDRMHLTASFVADPSSPGAYRADGTREGSEWVFLYGFGLDWAIVRNERWQLAPYFDANINGKGYGFHAGLMADVVMSRATLSMRAEWRWAKAPYAPDYFDLAYTIERKDYFPKSEYPISQALAMEETDLNHSGKLELRVESGTVSATGVFSSIGQDIYNASAVVQAKTGVFDFSVFGALRHFKFGHDPDRVLAMGEVRYRFHKFFYAWLCGGHLYHFNDENRARAGFLWSTGIGASFLLHESKSARAPSSQGKI